MLIAGSVKLADALAQLAARRPIFHSEADFQVAVAWQVQTMDPLMRVRLETRPEPGVHLDLDFARPDLDLQTAVELKYMTARWEGEHDGERFDLRAHGADDTTSYDVVKDIERVERFSAARPGCNGAVVALSNEPIYWNAADAAEVTNAMQFRLGEALTLSGRLAWGPNTGAGTKRSREADIDLSGTYVLGWRDFSEIPGGGHNRDRFRYLMVDVKAVA